MRRNLHAIAYMGILLAKLSHSARRRQEFLRRIFPATRRLACGIYSCSKGAWVGSLSLSLSERGRVGTLSSYTA